MSQEYQEHTTKSREEVQAGLARAKARAEARAKARAEAREAEPQARQAQQAQLPPKWEAAAGAKIRYILAVTSGKGGVGKSAVTAMLATQLARKGLRVGVLDADLMGPSMPRLFGVEDQMVGVNEARQMLPVETRLGIKLLSVNVIMEDKDAPVVWRGPVLSQVLRQFWQEAAWGELDILLIDTPPGTGDIPLTLYQSLPIDGLVMVATPQDLVTMIVTKASRLAEMLDVPILGLIENMSYLHCPHCATKSYVFGRGKVQEAADRLGVPLLAELPLDVDLAELMDQGRLVELPPYMLEQPVELLLAEIDRKQA